MPASKKNNQKHGLGRNFSSLIPTDLLDESFDPTAFQDQQVSELRQIKIDQIVVDPNQPRKDFNEIELAELAASIAEHGVLQPIIVTPYKNGYQIVAGERRFHASKIAKLDKIPALVRTLTDQHRLEISLIENLQRQDLNVMETATAYLKLRDQFNLTLEQIAQRVGLNSAPAVSNRLRLLKLPQFMQEKLAKKEISEGQARPLIGLDEKVMRTVVQKITKDGWSVRRVEQFVVDLKTDKKAKTLSITQQIKKMPYEKQMKHLKTHLKADVSISTNTKGSGKITIKFKNEKDFQRIQKLLG